jgi:hypothetical protein
MSIWKQYVRCECVFSNIEYVQLTINLPGVETETSFKKQDFIFKFNSIQNCYFCSSNFDALTTSGHLELTKCMVVNT